MHQVKKMRMPKEGDFIVTKDSWELKKFGRAKEYYGKVKRVHVAITEENSIFIVFEDYSFEIFSSPKTWRRIPKYAVAGFIARRQANANAS